MSVELVKQKTEEVVIPIGRTICIGQSKIELVAMRSGGVQIEITTPADLDVWVSPTPSEKAEQMARQVEELKEQLVPRLHPLKDEEK